MSDLGQVLHVYFVRKCWTRINNLDQILKQKNWDQKLLFYGQMHLDITIYCLCCKCQTSTVNHSTSVSSNLLLSARESVAVVSTKWVNTSGRACNKYFHNLERKDKQWFWSFISCWSLQSFRFILNNEAGLSSVNWLKCNFNYITCMLFNQRVLHFYACMTYCRSASQKDALL